jgi:hypothetical protein
MSERIFPETVYSLASPRREKSLVLALMLAMTVMPAVLTGANDDAAFDHVTTTHSRQDCGSSWRVAEIVCCSCYKCMSDRSGEKPDFYMGVIEIRTCLSYPGGYCAGEARCFQ